MDCNFQTEGQYLHDIRVSSRGMAGNELMNRCHVPCHVASDVYRFTTQSRPDPLQSLTPPLIPVLHVVKQPTKRTNFLRLPVDLAWLCTLKRHFRSCLWLPPSFAIAAIQYDIVIHLILTNGVFESMRKLQHAFLLTGLTAWSLPLSSAQSSTNTKSRAMSNVTSQNTHPPRLVHVSDSI